MVPFFMVPRAGLEPARDKLPHGPQPCVSADSTTSASLTYYTITFIFVNYFFRVLIRE